MKIVDAFFLLIRKMLPVLCLNRSNMMYLFESGSIKTIARKIQDLSSIGAGTRYLFGLRKENQIPDPKK